VQRPPTSARKPRLEAKRIGPIGDLIDGQPARFVVKFPQNAWLTSEEEHTVYVVRHGDQFDVFANTCTHMQCPVRFQKDRIVIPYGLNGDLGLRYQSVGGRIPHQDGQREKIDATDVHRDVVLTRRAMDSLGIDYMVVFPTPMLVLGMHPQVEMEVVIGNAFNKWLAEEILPQDHRIKAMLYLPFNHPEACVKAVEMYADHPGVIGFSVTSTRYRAVNHDSYMPLYSAIQDTGKPLAFHSGFHLGRHDDSRLFDSFARAAIERLGGMLPSPVPGNSRIVRDLAQSTHRLA